MSFDPSLPSLRDHLRLALGDTDSVSPLLADETIDAKLAAVGYLEALAQLAEALAVEAAQDPSRYAEDSSGMNIQWGERVAAWRQLALDARAGRIASPSGEVVPPVVAGQLDGIDKRDFRSD
ncbi:MAG: hypothetical protein JSS72_01875 [Armatimonadetes bacterium]|nr:hypothetical protein [Armatimonadota bacterium]